MAKKKSERQRQLEMLIKSVFADADKELKKHSAALKRLTREEARFSRQAQRRAAVQAAGAAVTPGTTTVRSRAASRFRVTRSSKNFAIGAEGVRIGHLRFNQAGRFSFSERTFLRGGTVLGVAVAGQILGNVGEASVRIRDEVKRGGDASKVVFKYVKSSALRILSMAGDLFGVSKSAATVAAWITGATFEETRKAQADLALLIFGNEDSIRDKATEVGVELAVKAAKNRAIQDRRRQRARAKDLARFPQDVTSQMESVREDLAGSKDEERLMVRDVTGVPLWKRVGLAVNAGA